MRVTINGQELVMEQPKPVAPSAPQKTTQQKIDHTFKKHVLPAAISTGLLTTGKVAFAAAPHAINIVDKVWPLITLLQDFAFPVGVAVASWGLIELMTGNPGGMKKVKMSIIGYVGIFLIPMGFETIREAFR